MFYVRLALIIAALMGMTIHSVATGNVAGMIIFPACFVMWGGMVLILWIQLRGDERDQLNRGV